MIIREIGALLRSGRSSCRELIEQTIGEARRDPHRSFITITETQALAEAAERDAEIARGLDRGPLHGIPFALKDLFYTKGVRTTAGSLIFRDFIPSFDATVAEKLRQAGGISIGKTNLHELAFGITSQNPHFGAVLNPLDLKRLPGGSSGGSAAVVAAGLVPFALGTDTGGSIRIPASYCGLVGLKPTYGRVSRYGVFPLAFTLDHIGPLTSCVEDCALTMNVLAGADPLDATCSSVPVPEFNLDALPDLAGVRVGIPENFFYDRLDEEIEQQIRNTISLMEQHGARISPVHLTNFEEAVAASRIVQLAEYASLYTDQNDPALFGADVWGLLQQGRLVAGHEYINAQRLRTLFRRDFDQLWQTVDVLLTPTTPIAAPLVTQHSVTLGGVEETTRMATTRLVRALNYLGEPVLSMPCGKTTEGLPASIQLISAPFTEPRLLQIAKTLEHLLGRLSFERQP